MSLEICRLCLSKQNLNAIFKDLDNWNVYSEMLSQTTGLKIEPNDGFPQSICLNCSNSVDSALNLRKTSHSSEIELLNRGYRKSKENNDCKPEHSIYGDICENNIRNELNNENNDSSNHLNVNNDGFRELNVEIQCDRLSENGGETKWLPDIKKMSRKDKRQMYLNLVDGVFDPKGPVKCKVCKKTVSKWTCFTSHAKLHLGFNFVCEFCGKSFISSTQLKRHCRSLHGMKRELKCRHCNYLALDNVQLKLHERRVHTGERPYVCDVCSAAYHSRRCLVQHLESHRTTATVQCDQCPRAFKSHRQLSRHRYSAHCTPRARCPHCDKTYTRKYLRAHVATHHADVTTI